MYHNSKYILLIIALIISGCEESPNHTQQATQLQHVGYLRLPLSDNVITLDPGIIYKNVQIEVVEQLFLGLTGFDPKTNRIVPELATNWQVSDDGITYT